MVVKKIKATQRRWYIGPLNMRRSGVGQLQLISDLRVIGSDKHMPYFRMDKTCLDQLLKLVNPWLKHAKSHAKPISNVEHLAITLRYLASGDCVQSVAFAHRVSDSFVRQCVEETYLALCNAMVA